MVVVSWDSFCVGPEKQLTIGLNLWGGLVDLSEEVKPLWSDISNGCDVSFSLVLL